MKYADKLHNALTDWQTEGHITSFEVEQLHLKDCLL